MESHREDIIHIFCPEWFSCCPINSQTKRKIYIFQKILGLLIFSEKNKLIVNTAERQWCWELLSELGKMFTFGDVGEAGMFKPSMNFVCDSSHSYPFPNNVIYRDVCHCQNKKITDIRPESKEWRNRKKVCACCLFSTSIPLFLVPQDLMPLDCPLALTRKFIIEGHTSK